MGQCIHLYKFIPGIWYMPKIWNQNHQKPKSRKLKGKIPNTENQEAKIPNTMTRSPEK